MKTDNLDFPESEEDYKGAEMKKCCKETRLAYLKEVQKIYELRLDITERNPHLVNFKKWLSAEIKRLEK